jgi:histidine phosphotransfer protein HptB
MKGKIRHDFVYRGYRRLSRWAQIMAVTQRSSAMALIDWQRVDDLASEIGADAVVEVVTMFLEETDEVITRLSGPSPTTEDYHFLKGSALNLGLADLATLCQLGEHELNAGIVSAQTQAAIITLYPASRDALIDGIAARFGG